MPAAGDARVASVVDIGSNTVLLLTVAIGADGCASQRDAAAYTTQLGRGLGAGGDLDAGACARTRAAVVACCARARAAGAGHCWAFATGAARRARDGARYVAALAQDAGCAIEILSGEDEGRLAYAAAAHGFASGTHPVLTVDVGGATTEVTFGRGERIAATASLPLGALHLTEAGAGAPAAIAAAIATAEPILLARAAGASVVASGGTATALAALDLGLATYEPARVHGHTLAADQLVELARRAATGRAALDPDRARILPAGTMVLAAVVRASGAPALRVSDHGVRHAYLRRRLAEAGVSADLRALWG